MISAQIAGFLAFAVALWITVGYLIGDLSGWRELARTYRCARLQGARWAFQSGRMRWLMSFHNVLEVDVDSEGLYLATFALFRSGFPPLQIPWQDIRVKSGKRFLWNYVEFRFRRAPAVFLRLSADLARKMAAEAGDEWPADRDAAIPF